MAAASGPCLFKLLNGMDEGLMEFQIMRKKSEAEIALPFWQSPYASHMQGVVSGALLHPTREKQITEDYQPPIYQIYTSPSNV